MKFTLPTYPYHTNARHHWFDIEGYHLQDTYWSWLAKEYGAHMGTDLDIAKDYWYFETEKDRDWFALRWS